MLALLAFSPCFNRTYSPVASNQLDFHDKDDDEAGRIILRQSRARRRRSLFWTSWVWAASLVILFVFCEALLRTPKTCQIPRPRQFRSSNGLLEVFQVYKPVPDLYQDDPKKVVCQETLMNHVFGWSYGHPYIGNCLLQLVDSSIFVLLADLHRQLHSSSLRFQPCHDQSHGCQRWKTVRSACTYVSW